MPAQTSGPASKQVWFEKTVEYQFLAYMFEGLGSKTIYPLDGDAESAGDLAFCDGAKWGLVEFKRDAPDRQSEVRKFSAALAKDLENFCKSLRTLKAEEYATVREALDAIFRRRKRETVGSPTRAQSDGAEALVYAGYGNAVKEKLEGSEFVRKLKGSIALLQSEAYKTAREHLAGLLEKRNGATCHYLVYGYTESTSLALACEPYFEPAARCRFVPRTTPPMPEALADLAVGQQETERTPGCLLKWDFETFSQYVRDLMSFKSTGAAAPPVSTDGGRQAAYGCSDGDQHAYVIGVSTERMLVFPLQDPDAVLVLQKLANRAVLRAQMKSAPGAGGTSGSAPP